MAIDKCCIGRGVAAFRYKRESSYYTYTYFKMKSLMDEIKQFNDEGTVFGSISKSDFQSFEINIPPETLVEKFQGSVKPIDDNIIFNCDTLLPKLMSGEVRVKTHGCASQQVCVSTGIRLMMNDKYKNKYRIQSHRMPEWDYSGNGFYFITLVTQNRVCKFRKN